MKLISSNITTSVLDLLLGPQLKGEKASEITTDQNDFRLDIFASKR
jgi:hypothetical protein